MYLVPLNLYISKRKFWYLIILVKNMLLSPLSKYLNQYLLFFVISDLL